MVAYLKVKKIGVGGEGVVILLNYILTLYLSLQDSLDCLYPIILPKWFYLLFTLKGYWFIWLAIPHWMPSNHGFKLNDLKCLSLSFSGFIKLLSFHLQVLMEIKSLWDIRSALRATPHSTYLREQGQNQAPYDFFFYQ